MEITLKTKFNLGDKVFFQSEVTSRVIEAKVTDIVIYHGIDGNKTYYKTEPYNMIREGILFSTRDELINNL